MSEAKLLARTKLYTVLHLVQGTPEWRAMRLKMANASQVPAYLGICPYSNWDECLTEKITGMERVVDPYKKILFEKGHQAEKAARAWLEESTGLKFPPAVLLSEVVPDLMASLDGFSPEENVIFEAKYMGKKNLEAVKEGHIQPHHHWQIQAQLLASGAKKCIYFVTTDGGDAVHMDIFPEPHFFDEIASVVSKFMKAVRLGVLPEEKAPSHFTPTDDGRFARLRELKAEFEALKEELVHDYQDHAKVKCDGVTISRTEVRGSVDYSAIPELRGVDLEKYRGKSTKRIDVRFEAKAKVKEGAM